MTSRLLTRMMFVWLITAASSRAAEPVAPPPVFSLEAYAAIGSGFAQHNRFSDLGMNEAQFEAFLDGMRASFRGTPKPYSEQAGLLQADILRRVKEAVAAEKMPRTEFFADPARLEAYMKQVTKTFQLERSDSGLAFGLLARGGGGSRPAPEDTVILSYKVSAADAKTDLPQISIDHRRVKVADLLPGLAEGIQMMTPESTALLVLPPVLSFGPGDWPSGVDRGTPLIFAVALHEVIAAP